MSGSHNLMSWVWCNPGVPVEDIKRYLHRVYDGLEMEVNMKTRVTTKEQMYDQIRQLSLFPKVVTSQINYHETQAKNAPKDKSIATTTFEMRVLNIRSSQHTFYMACVGFLHHTPPCVHTHIGYHPDHGWVYGSYDRYSWNFDKTEQYDLLQEALQEVLGATKLQNSVMRGIAEGKTFAEAVLGS